MLITSNLLLKCESSANDRLVISSSRISSLYRNNEGSASFSGRAVKLFELTGIEGHHDFPLHFGFVTFLILLR